MENSHQPANRLSHCYLLYCWSIKFYCTKATLRGGDRTFPEKELLFSELIHFAVKH